MDEKTASTLMSKAKLETAEMKMKTRIRKCFNLLPKDKAMKLDDKVSALDFDIGLPIRVSRINKTKNNPYFIWDDVKKLKVSFDNFEELACIVTPPNRASEKFMHYQTLVEELVNTLMDSIYELCRSHVKSLPSSFPQEFNPRVKEKETLQVSLEQQQQAWP